MQVPWHAYKLKLGEAVTKGKKKSWWKIKKEKKNQTKTTKENKGGFLKHMNCIKELDMHLF